MGETMQEAYGEAHVARTETSEWATLEALVKPFDDCSLLGGG